MWPTKQQAALTAYEQGSAKRATQALCAIHPSEQDAFVQACRELPFHEKMALFRDKRKVSRWLWAAIEADAPASRDALLGIAQLKPGGTSDLPSPKELRERAWNSKRPVIAFEQVRLREKSAVQYLERFSHHRQMCLRLVDENFLLPQAFVEKFGCEVEEIEAWLKSGKMGEVDCVQTYKARPALLRGLIERKALGLEALRALEPPSSSKNSWQTLLDYNLPLPEDKVEADSALEAMAFDRFVQGEISFETFYQSAPRPQKQVVQQSLAHRYLDEWQALRLGHLPTAVAQSRVEQGVWRALDVVAAGPVDSSLLRQWIDDKRVTPEMVFAKTVLWWHPFDALPEPLVATAHRSIIRHTLFDQIPLPRDGRRRRAYVERILAALLDVRGAHDFTRLRGQEAREATRRVLAERWSPARRREAFEPCATKHCVGGFAHGLRRQERAPCFVCHCLPPSLAATEASVAIGARGKTRRLLTSG